MKINLLTYSNLKNPESASIKSIELLRKAAEDLGYVLNVIQAKDCKLTFDQSPHILIKNQPIKGMKKILVNASFYGHNLHTHGSLIKQFELIGARAINSYKSISITKDKIAMLQTLSKAKIPLPKTYVVRSAEYVGDIAKVIGFYPVIIKTVSGSHGVGVSIVESQRALRSIVEMLVEGEENMPITIQEYVKESSGKDIRIFVVGNKIIAAMERIANKKGEFRSNFALGGKVRIAELSDEEKKLAIKAARVCGLDFSGVDLIRTKECPKILEVNSNPGLEGITQATNIDVAKALIKYYFKAEIEEKK